MGIEQDNNGNEKTVEIENVIINVHGSHNSISGLSLEDVASLDIKEIDSLVLLSCNTGNKSFNGNVATVMAVYQNVDTLIAPDGYNLRYGNFANGKQISLTAIASKLIYNNRIEGPVREGSGYTIYKRLSQRNIKVISGITYDNEKISAVESIRRGQYAVNGAFTYSYGIMTSEIWTVK